MRVLILSIVMLLATPALALNDAFVRSEMGEEVYNMLGSEERCWIPSCEAWIRTYPGEKPNPNWLSIRRSACPCLQPPTRAEIAEVKAAHKAWRPLRK